ncbi:MAG TPA: metal-dependent hydrolase [Pseudonocardiaceae bacterium]|nr:metal-dependent hydrolase [Pseudonocardiaceae bacterium]
MISGAAAGLGLGAATHAPPVTCAILAGVTMLGALVPDIDCPSSTVSRFVPVLGRVVSWIVRRASAALYSVTKGPRDENWEGTHRHLTHTLLFAAGLGFLVTLLATPWTGTRPATLIGVGIGLGCLTHDVGDTLTLRGCPILFPLPIAGEYWYELRPPRPLRFRTGGWVEHLLVFPALYVTTALLIPGVWPIVWPLVSETARSLRR